MKISLTAKVNAFFICLIVLMGIFLGWFSVNHEVEALKLEMDKRAETIIDNLAYNCESSLLVADYDSLSKLLEGILRQADIVFTEVMDENGKSIRKVGSKEKKFYKEYRTPVLTTAQIEDEDDLAWFEEDEILTNVPVSSGVDPKLETIGYVSLGISLKSFNKKINNVTKIITITILISIVLSTLVAYFGIHYFIHRPLNLLVSGIKITTEGDLAHRIAIITNDELAEVTRAFNKMMEDLSKTLISKEYFDNIVKSILDSLIVVNENGHILTVNRATLELLSYEEKELVGMPVEKIFADKSRKDFSMPELISCETVSNIEKTYLTKKGKKIPVLFSSSVMRNKNGRIGAVIFVGQDITELKAFNEKLKKSNKDLQDFAYVASHDLQEPLRKVIAFGDRLKVRCGDALSDQGKDYLERMQSASFRMQNLIVGLLAYSRVTTKAKPFEKVDLNVVIREVLADLDLRIEQTDGRMELKELPVIAGDPLQIRQLFQNLVSNALKFNHPDRTPVVKVYHVAIEDESDLSDEFRDVGLCRIIVEDNGIGFEEKYAEKIFGVFQRLHGRTSEYEGTGIGLSICRKIVERHRGNIVAKGIPGQGAKFIITLPIA